jgi:hypothetical protein
MFARDQGEFRRKVVLVVLPGATQDEVPYRLHGLQRFTISQVDANEPELQRLVRALKKRPPAPAEQRKVR